MGIFSKAKQQSEEEIKETIQKCGLDIDSYDTDKIREENYKNLKQVALEVNNNKWFRAGMAIMMGAPDKQATVGALNAIVNQNWILIRQNELIIRLLEKLAQK